MSGPGHTIAVCVCYLARDIGQTIALAVWTIVVILILAPGRRR